MSLSTGFLMPFRSPCFFFEMFLILIYFFNANQWTEQPPWLNKIKEIHREKRKCRGPIFRIKTLEKQWNIRMAGIQVKSGILFLFLYFQKGCIETEFPGCLEEVDKLGKHISSPTTTAFCYFFVHFFLRMFIFNLADPILIMEVEWSTFNRMIKTQINLLILSR